VITNPPQLALRPTSPSPILRAGAGLLAAAFVAAPALAQPAKDFPTKPIRMIVPFPPGGSSDIIARVTGQKLTEAWGQPVTVDSRPGAGGSLGAEIAARTPPDGYTLLVGNAAPISSNPLLIKVQYDSLRDFAPITLVARAPQLVIVHPSLPVRNVKELISFVRAQKGKIDYGTSGVGTIAHLSTEMFKNMTGVEMTHITYKGMALVVNALAAGEIPIVFSDMAPGMVQLKAGKVRAIATTGLQRSSLLPDLPAVSETLPGFNLVNWWGLFAPAKTPAPIVSRISETVVKGLQTPDVRERFAGLGVEVATSTPEEMLNMVKTEMSSFGALIKAQKIRSE
jgi:tripartite-type tricarboxylate transporter receptor subunit TctC